MTPHQLSAFLEGAKEVFYKKATKAEMAALIEDLTGDKLTPAEIRSATKSDFKAVIDLLESQQADHDRMVAETLKAQDLEMRSIDRQWDRRRARGAAARNERLARAGAVSHAEARRTLDQLENPTLSPEEMDARGRASQERAAAREEGVRAKQAKEAKKAATKDARKATKKFGKKIDKWAGDSRIKKGLGGVAKGGRLGGLGLLRFINHPAVSIPLGAYTAYEMLSSEGESEGDVMDALIRSGEVGAGVELGTNLAQQSLSAPVLARDTSLSEIGAGLGAESGDQLGELNSVIEGRRQLLANIGVQTGPSLAEVMAQRGMI